MAWIFVIPSLLFRCWNPNSQGDDIRWWAFRRWWGHEGWALMNRISARVTEAWEFPIPSPCEDSAKRRSSVNQEVVFYQTINSLAPWSWAFQPAELWELCLLYMSHPEWYFCYSSVNRLRQYRFLNVVCLKCLNTVYKCRQIQLYFLK